MFAIDQPAFEATARVEALQHLKSLPPDVLYRVAEQIRDFNSRADDDIDEAAAHRLVSELTFVYFLLPVSISNGHTIFRGRPVDPGGLLPVVGEFGPPLTHKAGIGRANGAGDPLFHGGSSDETVFAEIRATAGSSINIAAFTVKSGRSITAHVIGELDHYRRWRRNRFLPAGLEEHGQNILAELHSDVALAVQLVDAFLADRFSRSGKEAYRVTNLIAREFLRSQSIDAIIYPSVTHPGGTNYAIKADVSRERLEARACVAVEILTDYGYGHLSPQAMLEAVNVVGNVVAGARVGRPGTAANQPQATVATA